MAVSGRPVVNVSLALNYALNSALGVDQRPDPLGPNKTIAYHLTNVLIHLLCGALLFLILRHGAALWLGRAAGDDQAALFAGVVTSIWLLHPVQSEAVNYVSQRTELLVSFCYLGVLYSWIRGWQSGSVVRRRLWRLLAVAICAIGMGTKEVMVTAPIIVLMYDWLFHSARNRAPGEQVTVTRGWYVLLGLTWLVLLALNIGGARANTAGFGAGIAWYDYLYTQMWAVTHYLYLLVWPAHQRLDYGSHHIDGWRGIPGTVLLVILGAITIVSLGKRRAWGWVGFMGAWFFLLLAPSSSVIPIATEIAAERRVYLASAAAVAAVVIAAAALLRTGTNRPLGGRLARNMATAAVLVTLATLFGQTFKRSGEYAHPEQLWAEVVDAEPLNPRGYAGMAYTLLHQRPPAIEPALPFLKTALSLDSTNLTALRGLAGIAVAQHQFAVARPLLEREMQVDPVGRADTEALLGIVLASTGEPDKAASYLKDTDPAVIVEDDPTGELLVGLGSAYMALGDWQKAERTFRIAHEVRPQDARLDYYLGDAMLRTGQAREAIALLEHASQSQTATPMGLALLSLAHASVGETGAALSTAGIAASRNEHDPLVFFTLGRAMMRMHRPDQAETYFGEALRLAPGDPELMTALAFTKRALGKAREAEALLGAAKGAGQSASRDAAPGKTPAR
ncbi:MAG: tetratricopeptide repeat protein [bacterium]